MTVQSSQTSTSYAGGQSVLTFTWRTLVSNPNYVQVSVISSGTVVPLVYNVGYTVSVNASGVGGTVTVLPTYSSACTYVVYRQTAILQNSSYSDYNSFPASTLENDLDTGIMIEQETNTNAGLLLTYPIGTSTSYSTTMPLPISGYSVIGNSSSTGFISALVTGSTGATGATGPSGSTGATGTGVIKIGTYPFTSVSTVSTGVLALGNVYKAFIKATPASNSVLYIQVNGDNSNSYKNAQISSYFPGANLSTGSSMLLSLYGDVIAAGTTNLFDITFEGIDSGDTLFAGQGTFYSNSASTYVINNFGARYGSSLSTIVIGCSTGTMTGSLVIYQMN